MVTEIVTFYKGVVAFLNRLLYDPVEIAVHSSRRTFLSLLCAPAVRAAARNGPKITDIEIHEILPPYHDYHAKTLFRYHGLGVQLRTIYVVKTDSELEGLGESWGLAPKRETLKGYIGTSPFDWLGSRQDLAMNMALYDIMGRYLGVPAWKLIGPRVRSWVPVSGWTVSQTPEAMAEEVRRISAMGFGWLKYHVDVLHNVVDQTAAMQKVAPPGFKIHYDFNADSNGAAILPVLRELEKFPVAGRFEDPLVGDDREGYRELRRRCSRPIVVHHAPIDVFMLERLCDGVMAGHAPVGEAARLAGIAESTNTPVMLQQCGGMINRAFLAHEAAVFRMAVIPHVDLCHLWRDDVTREAIPVVGGSVRVPDGRGLGITLDREKLQEYARAPRPTQDRFLVRARYAGGPTVYFRFNPDAPGANLRSLAGQAVPGPVPGYANPVQTDFWDEAGTAEFEDLWKQTASGPVWKQ
jgi:glucarate dehydratase